MQKKCFFVNPVSLGANINEKSGKKNNKSSQKSKALQDYHTDDRKIIKNAHRKRESYVFAFEKENSSLRIFIIQ